MNRSLLVATLAGFVAGVLVGAQLWFALLLIVAAAVAWQFLGPPPSSRLKP